jgi:hypothetical protein
MHDTNLCGDGTRGRYEKEGYNVGLKKKFGFIVPITHIKPKELAMSRIQVSGNSEPGPGTGPDPQGPRVVSGAGLCEGGVP